MTIGATISLVAQIYQIHGDTARFFLAGILLGLPIVYVLRSSVAASLYFIGATTWVGCTVWPASPRDELEVLGFAGVSAAAFGRHLAC